MSWYRYFDYEHVPKNEEKKNTTTTAETKHIHRLTTHSRNQAQNKVRHLSQRDVKYVRTHTHIDKLNSFIPYFIKAMMRPIHTCNQFVLLGMTFSFEKYRKKPHSHTHARTHTPREREGKTHKPILKSAFILCCFLFSLVCTNCVCCLLSLRCYACFEVQTLFSN